MQSHIAPIIRIFWNHAARYPWMLFATIFSFFVSALIFNVLSPLLYKRFFDVITTTGPSGIIRPLIVVIFMILGINVIEWIFRRIANFSSISMQARVMRDLTETAFAYLQHHSYRFFTNAFGGTLVRRVNRFSLAFETLMDTVIFTFIPLITTSIGVLAILFYRNTLLGWILLAWVVIAFLLNYLMARWKYKYDVIKSARDSAVTGTLSDAIVNNTNVKLFSGFHGEETILGRAAEALSLARIKAWGLNEILYAIQGIFIIAVEFALMYTAVLLWQRGLITVGDFVLIQIYLLGLLHHTIKLGHALRVVYQAFADAKEMVDILNQPHEIQDIPRAKKLIVTEGRVIFDAVSFNFRKTRNVLRDFSLDIASGEKIALVGPSGAGKSTVTKLLLRLYDVTQGEILIDGQNIARVTQESLHNAIALVPQEPILFHRTLKDNIRYGNRRASDKQIITAAKQAHCHEFITALPEKYETFVGERGIKLSGGERQRVAIARAILKDAPILVLDEATSSLDSESEMYIQDALQKLIKGRTTIVIAHRLSTIMQMDRIVVVDEGRVVAMGTHDALIHKEGIYKKLWEIQAGGFLR